VEDGGRILIINQDLLPQVMAVVAPDLGPNLQLQKVALCGPSRLQGGCRLHNHPVTLVVVAQEMVMKMILTYQILVLMVRMLHR